MGIWVSGLIVFITRGAPEFYPAAMSGGAIWCTGNCMTVYIIDKIGLGPGLVVWGTSALIIGWLTGFFGLFGLPSERPCLSEPWLNVAGLGLAMAALVDSTYVKKGPPVTAGVARCNGEEAAAGAALCVSDEEAMREMRVAATRRGEKKGMLAAILAGCCYGANFLPSTWIQNHVDKASSNGLDYVFNQFCGILVMSMIYFLCYCAYKNNKPNINPEIVLPGFLSGLMWGVAQSCWFVANVELGYAAAFPIILIGPGFIGSMWSVFLFKDISGRKNYCYLAGYFVLAVASCACIVASRKSDPACS